jgi:D-alanyl-lipoteichoic acid acyltransferase DltB (MBOAT superfamily)
MRDYLYIPLGGSRGSAVETYRNLSTVFVLCGLWHGANWTFIIWGLHHGFFLVIERAGLLRALERAPVALSRLYALLAIMSGWVWFRARDLDYALTFFGSLVGVHGWTDLSLSAHMVLQPVTLCAALIGAILATTRIEGWRSSAYLPAPAARLLYGAADTIAIGLFFGLTVLSVAAGAYSPFLYFRF